MSAPNPALRRVVTTVAVLNLAYFGVEIGVALAINSVSLLADSIDFLEDASVNLLILLAFGWVGKARAQIGMVLAGLILVPSLWTIWVVTEKFLHPVVPAGIPLSLTGLGALVVNFGCALLLARYRHGGDSLTKAAFLSARNDVLANIAIIAAGVVTAAYPSIWPDLVVGLAIAALNAGAASEVWQAARTEHREAQS